MRKSLAKKQPQIHALIAIGIYQLSRMRIKEHAAINETVKVCDELKRSWAKGLVNGILREFQRSKFKAFKSENEDMAFNSSHPNWLIDMFEKSWGTSKTIELMENNNIPGPLTLRVNTKFTTREAYLDVLAKVNIKASFTAYSDKGIQLKKPLPVERIPEFNEGAVSVQDEAAQLAPSILNYSEEHLILDACCAPGGKTCDILESEHKLGSLLSVDSNDTRLKKAEENAARLGLHGNFLNADLCKIDDWWDGNQFDRIMLDAPCSGTGVIRRNPDIKLLRKASDISKLAEKQFEIMSAIWPNPQIVYEVRDFLVRIRTQNLIQEVSMGPLGQHCLCPWHLDPFSYLLGEFRCGHPLFPAFYPWTCSQHNQQSFVLLPSCPSPPS